ncbi:MAG TPA: metallophosphoesterase [archaeon]|nr:metallophosphoesterase [archaeon]
MRRRVLLWLLASLLILFACDNKSRSEPFSFIVLDDLHFARAADYDSAIGLEERTLRTVRQSEATFLPLMNELKNQANTFIPAPVAIFSCGDIVHGGVKDPAAQYQRFFAEYNSVSMPVPLYNAVGNHEIEGAGMETAYDSAFLSFMSKEAGRKITSRHFSLDFGNSHFILIDCLPPNRRGGDHDQRVFELMDEQWRWLEADLEANRDKGHIFVFMHPTIWPVNSGDVWYVYDPGKQRDFVDLLLKYNVRACFAGHEHVYSITIYENKEGKQLIQMISNSEISLQETPPGTAIRDYSIRNVASGEYPWSQGLQDLVLFYQERIRYFKKTPRVAGYFIVTVDGPQVSVRMYKSPGQKLFDSYMITANPAGGTDFSYNQP